MIYFLINTVERLCFIWVVTACISVTLLSNYATANDSPKLLTEKSSSPPIAVIHMIQIGPNTFKEHLKDAKQGSVFDQTIVAYSYLKGHGVPQNYGKAMEWYQKAAQEGSPEGLYGIGHLYSTGKGVPRDDRKALEYFKQSADRGNNNANLEIGWSYRDGRGVPRDLVKAYQWIHSACSHNSVVQKRRLVRLMSSQELALAKQLVNATSQEIPNDCPGHYNE